jgi:hypothetical protein
MEPDERDDVYRVLIWLLLSRQETLSKEDILLGLECCKTIAEIKLNRQSMGWHEEAKCEFCDSVFTRIDGCSCGQCGVEYCIACYHERRGQCLCVSGTEEKK